MTRTPTRPARDRPVDERPRIETVDDDDLDDVLGANDARLSDILPVQMAELKAVEQHPGFRILSDDALDELGDPVPLIDGVLYRDTTAQITGATGSFKTFIGIDKACSLATGEPWQGHKVHRGEVVYVIAEGAHGIRKRVAAWKAAHNLTGKKIGVHFVVQSVIVNNTIDVAVLLLQLHDLGVKPVAIFIDTLARNFKGNESATEDMNAYIAGCNRLREATGATVVSVHHIGYADADRGRGSSAQPAAVDTEIIVAADSMRVKITNKKQKDAAVFAPFTLEMRRVEGSLVPFQSSDPVGLLGDNDRKSLQTLQAYFGEEGGTATAWERSTGIAHGSFFDALKRLRDARYVELIGKKYRPTASGLLLIQSKSSSGPDRSNGGGSVSPSSSASLRMRTAGLDLDPGSEEERRAIAAYEERERLALEARQRKDGARKSAGAER